MEDDQQFCLRWNNHQSTLVAVFDTLLENGTLVDCTLAAEGKYLNAHKVVLSACSPYFESLLSQNYDKHPIFILKDVKFQELKAMMDYMYRGEVNISQDQLGALLKAAESLQIKGLSDNKKEGGEARKQPPAPAKSPPPTAALPRVQGLTIEQRRSTRNVEESREGSQSPGPRKRKRMRRRSTDDLDNHHDASNSSESHHSNPTPIQNIPIALPPASSSKITADVPEPVETKSEILTRHKIPAASESEIPQVPIIKEKIETHSELMLEPKSEYVDEMNDENIEDLTLDDDDDDMSNLEMSNDGAGPSHGNAGEGSSQGFAGWHMGNQNQDEVFLAAQEAVGAHRDSQVKTSSLERIATHVSVLKEDITTIKSDVTKINTEYIKITIMLDKIFGVLSKQKIEEHVEVMDHQSDGDYIDVLGKYKFPLDTCEIIAEFEEDLKINKHFRSHMISTLSQVGGNAGDQDGIKIGYKIIDQLFTSDVLTKYSWTGISRIKAAPEKKAFQSLEGILSVLFEVLSSADSRHTRKRNENMFKEGVLKHAKKRNLRKRCSKDPHNSSLIAFIDGEIQNDNDSKSDAEEAATENTEESTQENNDESES